MNGKELGYTNVRISDYWIKRIEAGEIQILVENGKVIPFRKKSNGYWINNTSSVRYLHREVLKQELGLTEEQIKGLHVHHIDGNKDNNKPENLTLISAEAHNKLHKTRNENSKRHVCIVCGRTYYSTVSSSLFKCDRCK